MQGIASPRQRVKQAGVSLVETLVALALGMALVSVAFNLYVSNRSVFQQIEAMTRLQESASIASALLETDIRHAAGVLCRNDAPLTNLLNNPDFLDGGSPGIVLAFSNGLKGYPTSTETDPIALADRCTGDSLSIYSANTSYIARVTASATQTTTATATTGSYTFTVDDASKFSVGDVALACDYDRAVLFQVTQNATTTPQQIIFSNPSAVKPGNCGVRIKASAPASSDTVAPPRCVSNPAAYKASAVEYTFGPGSMIGKFSFTHWYIGKKTNEGTCKLPSVVGNPVHNLALHRKTVKYNGAGATTTDDEMVENVTDMKISYLNGWNDTGYPGADNYVAASAVPNWTRVIAVRIELTLTSPERAGLAAGNVATYTIPITATVRARMPGIVRR